MTIKTIPQLKTDVNTVLADNTTGDITPADVRSSTIDTIDSIVDLLAGSTIIINVQSSSDFGVIDSTKVYLIDGIIDMTGVTVEIPIGGISIIGTTFDVSQLVCAEDNYTMFTSSVSGCGNMQAQNVAFEVSGTSSQLLDLVGATGNEAFEFIRVNFNDCTSIGVLDTFRQGLETGTGRFGGTPSLELKGTWSGGYFIDTSIIRNVDNAMTSAIYKAGAGFTMASRFRSNQNADLGTLAPFIDFSSSNFGNPSLLQLHGCLITRNGVQNANDTTIFPNIDEKDISSSWVGNNGLPNTLVGGKQLISTEVLTTIGAVDTFYTLLGTWTTNDLQHFDSPSNGQLRHIGNNPREYRLFSEITIDGNGDDLIGLRLGIYDDSAATTTFTIEQQRIIIGGSLKLAFFTVLWDITLDKNDYVYLEVVNRSGSSNVTATLQSFTIIDARG